MSNQKSAIEILTEEMIIGISAVLHGKKKKFKAHGISPEMADDYLKSLGWKRGEMETNGWQGDRWIPYTKGGTDDKFTVFHQGWSGEFIFEPTED